MGRLEVSDHGKAGGRVPHRAVPGAPGSQEGEPNDAGGQEWGRLAEAE